MSFRVQCPGSQNYGDQGLCAYVLEHVNDAKSRGAVIGHDHRHHSERWARLTAAAFHNKGVKTYLYRGLVHTPMQVTHFKRCAGELNQVFRVPFGVKRLNAACGVMITGPCGVDLQVDTLLISQSSQPQPQGCPKSLSAAPD